MSEERKLQFRGGIGMSLIPVAIYVFFCMVLFCSIIRLRRSMLQQNSSKNTKTPVLDRVCRSMPNLIGLA